MTSPQPDAHPDPTPGTLQPAVTGQVLIDVGARQNHTQYLSDVWRRRDFAFRYPIAMLRAQNAETALGMMWQVLNPLLLVAIFAFIRGVLFPNDSIENFLAFLSVGVFSYNYMQSCIMQGARSVETNSGLIRSIKFPVVVLPLQLVIKQSISQMFSIFVMLVLILATGVTPRWSWILLPLLLGLQLLFSLGGAVGTARFGAVTKDFTNLLPFLLRLGFYLSGVIYSVDGRVDSELIRNLFNINPFYANITLARAALLGTDFSAYTLTSAVLWAAILPVVGYLIFRTGDELYGS